MNNQFDRDNFQDGVPQSLTAGSFWGWKNSAIDQAYPVADYTLEFRFVAQSLSHSDFSFQASKTATNHIAEVASSVTYGYTPDAYRWHMVVIRDSDSEEVVVNQGFTEVRPDLSVQADIRSHVYKTLQAIRATIEKTATKEQQSYSIAGRSLSRRTIAELLELRDKYERLWEKEKAEVDAENGRTSKKRVLVRMGG